MQLLVDPVVVECLLIVVKQVKVVQVLQAKEMQVVMECLILAKTGEEQVVVELVLQEQTIQLEQVVMVVTERSFQLGQLLPQLELVDTMQEVVVELLKVAQLMDKAEPVVVVEEVLLIVDKIQVVQEMLILEVVEVDVILDLQGLVDQE
tara:strand:- start:119 stop:565 length:447 start_codon:yes stop_codon:yes gene_type:complete